MLKPSVFAMAISAIDIQMGSVRVEQAVAPRNLLEVVTRILANFLHKMKHCKQHVSFAFIYTRQYSACAIGYMMPLSTMRHQPVPKSYEGAITA